MVAPQSLPAPAPGGQLGGRAAPEQKLCFITMLVASECFSQRKESRRWHCMEGVSWAEQGAVAGEAPGGDGHPAISPGCPSDVGVLELTPAPPECPAMQRPCLDLQLSARHHNWRRGEGRRTPGLPGAWWAPAQRGLC